LLLEVSIKAGHCANEPHELRANARSAVRVPRVKSERSLLLT